MLSANKDTFTSFPIFTPFISFSCLNALLGIQIQGLIEEGGMANYLVGFTLLYLSQKAGGASWCNALSYCVQSAGHRFLPFQVHSFSKRQCPTRTSFSCFMLQRLAPQSLLDNSNIPPYCDDSIPPG